MFLIFARLLQFNYHLSKTFLEIRNLMPVYSETLTHILQRCSRETLLSFYVWRKNGLTRFRQILKQFYLVQRLQKCNYKKFKCSISFEVLKNQKIIFEKSLSGYIQAYINFFDNSVATDLKSLNIVYMLNTLIGIVHRYNQPLGRERIGLN